MAVFANGGTISDAITSSARTSPRARPRANGRGASGATASRIRCWASCSEITTSHELGEASPTRELADPFGERGTEIGSVEGHFDVGSEIIDFLADVVAAAVASQP